MGIARMRADFWEHVCYYRECLLLLSQHLCSTGYSRIVSRLLAKFWCLLWEWDGFLSSGAVCRFCMVV